MLSLKRLENNAYAYPEFADRSNCPRSHQQLVALPGCGKPTKQRPQKHESERSLSEGIKKRKIAFKSAPGIREWVKRGGFRTKNKIYAILRLVTYCCRLLLWAQFLSRLSTKQMRQITDHETAANWFLARFRSNENQSSQDSRGSDLWAAAFAFAA